MKKVYDNAAAALDGVLFDGMTIAAGGFGLCGIPELLIAAIRDAGTKNLTVISNNAGVDGFGLGMLLQTRQIKKMISSYVGENKEFVRQYLAGELELEFTPQGTLAEQLRAGGAGIPAFFTKTGVGTVVAEGKEHKEFDGETYVMERGIVADLVARQGLEGRRARATSSSARPRATSTRTPPCGKVCIAEVEEIVPLGALDPDDIHLPGIFVHRIVQGQHEKRIEQRTIAQRRRPDRCPGPKTRWPPARRRNSRTASTSTSASACRRWSPTTSRRASRSAAVRERHARHRPVPDRGRGRRRPDQRRQADRHRARRARRSSAAPTASR